MYASCILLYDFHLINYMITRVRGGAEAIYYKIASIPDTPLRADCFFGTDDDYGELELSEALCALSHPHAYVKERKHKVHTTDY